MNNFATTVRQELINKGIPEEVIRIKEHITKTVIIVDLEPHYIEIIDWKSDDELETQALYTDSATTLYGLYRNENMVLVGNDAYENTFIDAATNIVQDIYKMRV